MTLTEELGVIPPPSHSWTTPLVENMLPTAITGLTKVVVTDQCRAILFYGRHLMEEGLTADEASDAAFLLTGAGTWVGKLVYLTANPMTIQEGKRAIAQAVSANRIKARGSGHPHVNLLTQQPFWFNAFRISPPKDVSGYSSSGYPQSPCRPSIGQEHNSRWRDQRPQSPRFPSPSLGHGFETNRSLLSTMSSMSFRSDHSNRSRCSRSGRH